MNYCKVTDGTPYPDEPYPSNVHNPELYSQADMAAIGFYPIVPPAYDSRYQELGDVYFDEINEVVTHTVQTVSMSLADARAKVKDLFRHRARRLLSRTDWYVVRNSETGEAIPTSVSDERSQIRSACNADEAAIDGLTDLVAILTYSPTF